MDKLYKIADDIMNLAEMAEQITDEGGNGMDFIADTLEVLEMEFDDKCENIAKLVRQEEARIEAANKEIARLKKLVGTSENTIKGVKNYLLSQMERIGRPKVECGVFTVSVRPISNPAVILDVDMANLPEEYIKVKTEVMPDKKKMGDLLKEQKKKLESGEITEDEMVKYPFHFEENARYINIRG